MRADAARGPVLIMVDPHALYLMRGEGDGQSEGALVFILAE